MKKLKETARQQITARKNFSQEEIEPMAKRNSVPNLFSKGKEEKRNAKKIDPENSFLPGKN